MAYAFAKFDRFQFFRDAPLLVVTGNWATVTRGTEMSARPSVERAFAALRKN